MIVDWTSCEITYRMTKNRRDYFLNLRSRKSGWRKSKRILTLVLLLVSPALPVPAAAPLKHAAPSALNPAGHPVAALIHNPLFGLPEPVGMSLIIFAGMLLAWAGLNRAWSKPQLYPVVAGGAKPTSATDPTDGPGRRSLFAKTAGAPKVTPNSWENQNPHSLLALFCKKYNCSPAEFSERLLRLCLKPQARPWAAGSGGFTQSFFQNDLELIQQVENLSDLRRIKAEINIFGHYNKFRPRTFETSFFQHTLGVRLSGRRLTRLARKLFSESATTT